MARMVNTQSCRRKLYETERTFRTAEQAEGGKVVGVDPSVITAGACSRARQVQGSFG